jgi:hypothetical protein
MAVDVLWPIHGLHASVEVADEAVAAMDVNDQGESWVLDGAHAGDDPELTVSHELSAEGKLLLQALLAIVGQDDRRCYGLGCCLVWHHAVRGYTAGGKPSRTAYLAVAGNGDCGNQDAEQRTPEDGSLHR